MAHPLSRWQKERNTAKQGVCKRKQIKEQQNNIPVHDLDKVFIEGLEYKT
jgi:hypothetical protein